MLYSEEVLDRQTGELVTVSKGEWITVTELAALYGVGPRKARCVLRQMDFLGLEGARAHGRHRIQPWAVKRGYGRRNRAKVGARIPFDVISPEGREWVEVRWSESLRAVEEAASGSRLEDARGALAWFKAEYRLQPMPVHAEVSWLTHFFTDLSHAEVGRILEVSQQLVSRYVAEQSKERSRRMLRKNVAVPELGKIRQRGLNADHSDDTTEWHR